MKGTWQWSEKKVSFWCWPWLSGSGCNVRCRVGDTRVDNLVVARRDGAIKAFSAGGRVDEKCLYTNSVFSSLQFLYPCHTDSQRKRKLLPEEAGRCWRSNLTLHRRLLRTCSEPLSFGAQAAQNLWWNDVAYGHFKATCYFLSCSKCEVKVLRQDEVQRGPTLLPSTLLSLYFVKAKFRLKFEVPRCHFYSCKTTT